MQCGSYKRGEALTQKINDIAAAANIQPVQKEKSERQKIRDSLNETLKNITDDVMLKALGLYLANFNVPQVVIQNDIAEEAEEASATQTQEASPEKSATPNQMSTEEDLGISIPNSLAITPLQTPLPLILFSRRKIQRTLSQFLTGLATVKRRKRFGCG